MAALQVSTALNLLTAGANMLLMYSLGAGPAPLRAAGCRARRRAGTASSRSAAAAALAPCRRAGAGSRPSSGRSPPPRS